MDYEVLTGEEPKFFAPSNSDLLDSLLGQYQHMRDKIERIADAMAGPDFDGALHYFAQFANSNDRHLSESTVAKMFDKAGAIAFLNAAFWSKAMRLTDVLDVMPQARRDAWNAQIRSPLGSKRNSWDKSWETEPIPEFTEETVRATITNLLAQREQFFAERVDGLFRALSKTHVTNCPEGFSKRMILANVTDGMYPQYQQTGVINDLRCVIAKFMGRDEPGYDATNPVVRYARKCVGEWVDVDGGAMRIRCYMIGTAHLEIHPDMAWRLNSVLAQLYPLAIPSKFREKPKKKAKEYKMIGRPLPFTVLSSLSGLEQAYDFVTPENHYKATRVTAHGFYTMKSQNEEAMKVLEALGGVKDGQRWAFDFDPLDAVAEIVASGCLPDQKAHQFYPTPEKLARIAVELAEIDDSHECLEPSAGMGGIAELMPKTTTCIEISALHCKVLQAKGYKTLNGDFLSASGSYDRIVMNPPFSEGRWQAHTKHAAAMLKLGGRLVAVLPASAKSSGILESMNPVFHGPYENEFAGTSVSVVILVAQA
jgi:hypothetical protein